MTTQQLTPYTPNPVNQPILIPPPPRPQPRSANNLDEEINAMRGAMRLLYSRLEESPTLSDLAFYSATIARLSDSIVRALQAATKLNKIDQQTAELKTEIERVFAAFGWNKHP